MGKLHVMGWGWLEGDTKYIKERYKHQQSNVLRKVNKVVERV